MTDFQRDRQMNRDEMFTDTESLYAKVVELQELQAKYESMVEAFDGLIYTCSSDYKVEFMNRRFIERTGRNAVGENCFEALHGLESVCPWCVNDRVFRGETVRWEVLSPKDRHWYYVVNTPIRHPDGSVSKMGMIYDITDRKQAEERLRLLDFALDHVSEAAFLTDQDGQFRFVNEQSCRTLGYTRTELLDLGAPDIDPDFPMERWPSHWNDLKTHGSLMFEGRHRTKDGRVFPVEINANYFEYGGQGYNLALVRDVTKRREAEREHLANLRFFESMDRINRAIQGTNDLERMMSDVLDVVLPVFDCDRAFLLYPCDPEAASWTVPMERTKPECPGALALGLEMPMDAEVARVLQAVLDSEGPVKCGPETDHPVPPSTAERFDVQCLMSMALYPRGEKPWQFGILQCSYPRVWTNEEERLFQEIGRRLEDGLSVLLAHRNLGESEERFRTIFEQGPLGMSILRPDLERVAINAKLIEMFGYTEEELRKLTFLDLTHPDDFELTREHLDKLLKKEIPSYQIEKRYIKKGGEIIWVRVRLSAVGDAQGELLYLVSMIEDITEHKRAQEALRRANEDWEQTFNAIPDMVMVLDSQHRILRVNKAMAAVIGLSEQELKGRFCFELVHHRDEPPAFCPHSMLLEDGTEHHVEVFEPKLGRSLDVRVSPLSDETGTVIGAVHVMRDVTEQKNLQKQLLQAQKMESIGTLAGGIAHDFNNLLQVIIGYSDMLLFNTKPTEPDYERLNAIRRAGRDGAELAKRILAFSRRLEPNARPIDLNNEIVRVQKMLERTVSKMIRIEILLADNLQTVNADPSQMEQMLLNLAVNAQHAMPDGGRLTIETANVTLDEDYSRTHLGVEPGRYVLLSVSDTGYGMDKEVLEHIFEPFYTTKEASEGTGLGLAMVFGIVKSHKGHIICYSEPGAGTTFKIYLPAIVQQIEQDVAVTRQMPAFGTETILLVDDEKSVRKLGKQMLRIAGYTVLTATNGRKALEIYRSNRDRIALVLLDLMMPEMGGKQCLEELLKIDPRVKVVIASGYSANGPTKDALASGAKGFVDKPHDIRQVLEAVRRVLDAE